MAAASGVKHLLQNNHPFLLFLRRLSAAPSPPISAVSPLALDAKACPHPPPDPPSSAGSGGSHPILDFDDTRGLFSNVPTSKLLKSWLTLQMTAADPVVDLGMRVMNSRLMMETPLLKLAVLGAIRHTFYDHFCAGRDLEEAGRTISRLWEDAAGLRAMLDYCLEHASDNDACHHNMIEFLNTVDSTKSLPPTSVSFVVVKITAICPPSLLRRVSDLLRWEYRGGSAFHLPWKVDCFPIFSDSSPFYHTPKKPNPLTPEEEQNFNSSHERLFKICEKCIEANIRILIDAEATALQPAIDYLTYSSAILHRKNDNDPLLFGTIQAYLKDSKERLVRAKKAADEVGVPMGFKLVRGAYMSSERKLAASLGAQSPIQDSIQETHANYNDCASFLLEEVARGSGSTVLATHNVESGI